MREEIIKALIKALGLPKEKIKLEIPTNPAFGDYAFFSKNPQEVIGRLKKDESLTKMVEKIEVVGKGFINFWLRNKVLLDTLRDINIKNDIYGKSDIGKGKTVVIDYSSPNIAKPFGVGHLRSTIIGDTLYNLYGFLGFKVIGDNHLGDWGTQFGKLLYMLDTTLKDTSSENLTIDDLEKIYVEFHKKAKDRPELESKAREWFKKLEDGDPKARKLWQVCVDLSLKEFDRIYDLLGIKVDFAYGESFYEDKMEEVIKLAKDKKLAKESKGALVINLPGQKVPLMLLKEDGATTYATRDLATLAYRMQKWNPAIIIYEVGVEQSLHFQQVFATARLLGLVNKEVVLYHTQHGWYLGPDGKKFSTREGKTVKLEEILKEAIERAKQLGCKDEKTAKMVGIGAIKYYDLMRAVKTDVVFNWEKIMNLQGNSGPYLQYTHARIQSVLAKSKNLEVNSKYFTNYESLTFNLEELSLLRLLIHFPEVLETASFNYAPNLLCNFLYDLASKYNTFYQKWPILEERTKDKKQSEFRLALTLACGQVLKNGLRLLGIESPERM